MKWLFIPAIVTPCIIYVHIVKQCIYFQNMLQSTDISFKYYLKYRPPVLMPYPSRSPFRNSVDSPFSLQFPSFKLLSSVCSKYNNILLSNLCATILYALFFNLSIPPIRPYTFKKNNLIFLHKHVS